jgi:TNF receptor-associated factor 4
MDQNPDVNARRHLVYAVKPRPTKENIPYLAKPKLERNAGFGAEKFCPLNQVQPFVRENVLFIRCQIDTEAMLVL